MVNDERSLRGPSSQLAPEPADQDAFFRALLAVRYLLGTRGKELLEPLELQGLSRNVLELAARLGHSDQRTRAQALAAELLRITSALERWSLR